MTIRNPILTGFNPDPSIVRVGDDYYVVSGRKRLISEAARDVEGSGEALSG